MGGDYPWEDNTEALPRTRQERSEQVQRGATPSVLTNHGNENRKDRRQKLPSEDQSRIKPTLHLWSNPPNGSPCTAGLLGPERAQKQVSGLELT